MGLQGWCSNIKFTVLHFFRYFNHYIYIISLSIKVGFVPNWYLWCSYAKIGWENHILSSCFRARSKSSCASKRVMWSTSTSRPGWVPSKCIKIAFLSSEHCSFRKRQDKGFNAAIVHRNCLVVMVCISHVVNESFFIDKYYFSIFFLYFLFSLVFDQIWRLNRS